MQLAGQFAEQGVRLRLAVPLGCAATLGRQVLKSDTAPIRWVGGWALWGCISTCSNIMHETHKKLHSSGSRLLQLPCIPAQTCLPGCPARDLPPCVCCAPLPLQHPRA